MPMMGTDCMGINNDSLNFVHTLQLTHGTGLDPKLEHAIAKLAEAGLIDPAFDADHFPSSRPRLC